MVIEKYKIIVANEPWEFNDQCNKAIESGWHPTRKKLIVVPNGFTTVFDGKQGTTNFQYIKEFAKTEVKNG